MRPDPACRRFTGRAPHSAHLATRWASCALLAAVGCTTDEAFTLPWWPTPRVAAPSPLLDAIDLAPPALDSAACHHDAPTAGRGWRGAVRRFVEGDGTWCAYESGDTVAHLPAPVRRVRSTVIVDPRGRTVQASRDVLGFTGAAATATADSLVRRGLRLPGARPLPCATPPTPDGAQHARWSVFRGGWQTDTYQAVVSTWNAGSGPSEPGHMVQIHLVHADHGAIVACTRLGPAGGRPTA